MLKGSWLVWLHSGHCHHVWPMQVAANRKRIKQSTLKVSLFHKQLWCLAAFGSARGLVMQVHSPY